MARKKEVRASKKDSLQAAADVGKKASMKTMASVTGTEQIPLEPRNKYDHTADEKIFYDVLVVGGGIVGYATAMYTGRLGMKTLVIGDTPGGTLALTHLVENFPGFISISGPQLVKRVENHAKDYDIDVFHAKVEKIQEHAKGDGRHFRVSAAGKLFMAKTVIICTGTKVKKLDAPGEKEYENKGVSYCALCDGPLFRNKIVGVVGGGDSAVKESLLLTEYAKKVFIICRADKLRAEPINMERFEKKIKEGKIEPICNASVKEIKGDGDSITQVVLDNPYKGKKELELQGLFVEIGHLPLSELAQELGITLNEHGEIIISRNSETNVKGIFAAGDVTDTDFKQAIIGVGEGVAAAYHAYSYVNKGEYILPLGQEDEII